MFRLGETSSCEIASEVKTRPDDAASSSFHFIPIFLLLHDPPHQTIFVLYLSIPPILKWHKNTELGVNQSNVMGFRSLATKIKSSGSQRGKSQLFCKWVFDAL